MTSSKPLCRNPIPSVRRHDLTVRYISRLRYEIGASYGDVVPDGTTCLLALACFFASSRSFHTFKIVLFRFARFACVTTNVFSLFNDSAPFAFSAFTDRAVSATYYIKHHHLRRFCVVRKICFAVRNEHYGGGRIWYRIGDTKSALKIRYGSIM